MKPNYVELQSSELMRVEGGFWQTLAAGLIIAVAVEIMNDWDNFKNGIAGRPEEKKP